MVIFVSFCWNIIFVFLEDVDKICFEIGLFFCCFIYWWIIYVVEIFLVVIGFEIWDVYVFDYWVLRWFFFFKVVGLSYFVENYKYGICGEVEWYFWCVL